MKAAARSESVMDPMNESLAAVYAEALLGQAPSDVEAEEAAAELDEIVRLLDESESFEALLTVALLRDEDRLAIVRRVFHGRVCPAVEALLDVMAQAGRLGLLRVVRRAFRSALYRRQHRREVTVTTAACLSDAERRHVIEALTGVFGREPVVAFHQDEALLGGMVVRMGDRVYDGSLQTELDGIQDRLAREIRLKAGPGPDEKDTEVGGSDSG